MERFEQLTPTLGFHYDDTMLSPTTDSFLLSSFPLLKAGLKVCDLGAGCGLLGLLLLARNPNLMVSGLELQPTALPFAQQNALENGVCHCFSVTQGDIRTPKLHFSTGCFDLMVSNPPYFTTESGFVASMGSRSTARTEATCSLEDVFQAAAYGLRWGGSFCLVHRPERLTDLLTLARTYKLEPKRMRFVCKQADAPPSLVLLDCRRGGKPALQILPPLILQQSDTTPTAEVDGIYFRT